MRQFSSEYLSSDSSKKAMTLGMGVLLAIAVGILLPYFKSEKLAFVDDPEEIVNLLKHHQTESLNPSSLTTKKPYPTSQKKDRHSYLVSMKYVNVRHEPSLNAKTILTIPPNQRVKLLKKFGGWRLISFFDHVKNQKVEGWAYYEFFALN